jgi:hypothetical protein
MMASSWFGPVANAGAVVSAVLLAAACSPAQQDSQESGAATATPTPAESLIVDFVASDFAFTGPPTMPSGWNTVQLRNEGEQTHFLTFWELPDGVTFDQYTGELIPAFFNVFGPYAAGDLSRDELIPALRDGLPDWSASMVNRGGAGLTSPGVTSATMVNLPPGNYVIECYVYTPEGMPHGVEGMLRPLIVTEEASGAEPPQVDVTINLTNYGFVVDAPLVAGTQTWAVHVADDPDGFLGYGLHLAQLTGDGDIQELIDWSDWVDGLKAPAPAQFLGGADAAPAGTTSYVTVTLVPGRYALVSKEYTRRGMVHEFVVE